jgi:hypothetical protein
MLEFLLWAKGGTPCASQKIYETKYLEWRSENMVLNLN